MKFKLTFKTPDIIDQIEDLSEEDVAAAKETLDRFVKYNECITIEFDTESQTAIVIQKE